MLQYVPPLLRVLLYLYRHMKPVLAPVSYSHNVKPFDGPAAAFVLAKVGPILKLGLLRMVRALVDFSESELFPAERA